MVQPPLTLSYEDAAADRPPYEFATPEVASQLGEDWAGQSSQGLDAM